MQEEKRKKLLAKIHIGKKTLGMDEETYRAFLKRETGQESAKNLSLIALEQVLLAMKRAGFKPKMKHYPPLVFVDKKRFLRKIEAILSEKDLPWVYAEGVAKKMFNKKISKLNQEEIKKLMQAFVIFQKRQKGEK